MSTSISWPTYLQNQPYCAIADVQNLIGLVGAMQDGSVSNGQIQAAIDAATQKIEQQTNSFFSPRRLVNLYDGNGLSRFVLPNRPLISINQLTTYFAYPLQVSQVAYDYNLLIDRQSAVISYPIAGYSAYFNSFGNSFPVGSRNILVDGWYGYTQEIIGDVLTTADLSTYAFSFPNVVKQSLTLATVGQGNPPSFFPVIYKNGVPLQNTTYLMNSPAATPFAQSQWTIASDNVYYALNDTGNGYGSVTFNSPLLPTDVVTADYAYLYVPLDIAEATAKLASITLLASIATGGGFSDTQFQGAVEVDNEGSKTRFNDTLGKWGHQITIWQGEIADVLAQRKRLIAQYGAGWNGSRY